MRTKALSPAEKSLSCSREPLRRFLPSAICPRNGPLKTRSRHRCSPERTRPVSTTVDSSVDSTRAGRMSDS